jgi:hypothetical protein
MANGRGAAPGAPSTFNVDLPQFVGTRAGAQQPDWQTWGELYSEKLNYPDIQAMMGGETPPPAFAHPFGALAPADLDMSGGAAPIMGDGRGQMGAGPSPREMTPDALATATPDEMWRNYFSGGASYQDLRSYLQSRAPNPAAVTSAPGARHVTPAQSASVPMDMGGRGGSMMAGALAPGRVSGAAAPEATSTLEAEGAKLTPGGIPVAQSAQDYVNSYMNWLATGRWGL